MQQNQDNTPKQDQPGNQSGKGEPGQPATPSQKDKTEQATKERDEKK